MAFGPVVRRLCPFCEWFVDDPGPTIRTDERGLPIETAHAVLFRHSAKIEAVLQSHLDTHVEEMATVDG